MTCFDAISRWYAGLGVLSIIVTRLNNFLIGLIYLGFLTELLFQELVYQRQVTIEQPANHAQCKHVATLQDRLVVHARVLQTLLDKCGNRTFYHTVGINTQLTQVILAGNFGLLQIGCLAIVGVDDDGRRRLGKL